MPHGPTYFPTKGACIYCGVQNVILTDEHIVPYSLGGLHVIREASCNSCADVTKKFEQKVARDLWGDARTSFDTPSRRKKSRSDFIPMRNPESLDHVINIPAGEYPGGFVFYKMDKPGLLQGLTENVDISKSWKMSVIDDSKRRERFLQSHPTTPLTLSFRHIPYEFGQLLCKIAHCQLLTVFDLDSFQPLCVPYIMGKKTNVSYLVGGVPDEPVPLPEIGYSLTMSGLISPALSLLLIVRIQLYANTLAPGYQVIAGEIVGKENIDYFIQKFGLTTKNNG